MRNAFNKEIARSIRYSAGRFVAIAIISLLGAGFYAGLRMAAPDMHLAGDEFFDGGNLYDLGVVTTLGLDDGGLDILAAVDDIGNVMPAYRADVLARIGDNSYATSFESLPIESAQASDTSDGVNALSQDEGYLNRPILLEGSWPSQERIDECVVGADAAKELGISIGDFVEIEKVAGGGKVADTFSRDRFTVTGLVNSAAFASTDMLGSTSLGTGSVELYAFVSPSAFDKDLPYSIAYLTVPSARSLTWGTGAYDDEVARVKRAVEDVSDDLAEERLATVNDDLHYQLTGVIQDVSVSLDWADELEKPDVFVIDRSKNPGAASLESDADGISQIATFLPFMFFLVAALVSLTSMTRMVEEERMVIGTHKALGYSSARITSKYLLFGVLASGLGSVTGIVLLGKALPWFIITSYQVTYAIPVVPLQLDAVISVRALALFVGITALATWWTAATTLKSKPAELMLPRAPKTGKRIVLERIPFLWSRMSFSQKVTARNLLRYKRRFFMAVAGVAGCTALLMIGFGLRDMISGIVLNQYEQLMSYDAIVRIDKGVSGDSRAAIDAALESSGGETARGAKAGGAAVGGAAAGGAAAGGSVSEPGGVPDGAAAGGGVSGSDSAAGGSVSGSDSAAGGGVSGSGSVPESGGVPDGAAPVLYADGFNLIARGSEDDMRIEIIVPSNVAQLPEFVTLRNRVSGQALSPSDDGVILTEKAARVLGVKEGDPIELFDENEVGDATGDARLFTVAGIAENYLGHYAYMTPAGYESAFDEKPRFDLAYVKLAPEIDPDAYSERLLSFDGVSTVSFTEDKIATYKEMLDIMNKLIYIIMMLSAALAFVVLYNLTNINIAEREREIATLKVLGFTRAEVNAYIFREVVVMSLIGALIGCAVGVPAAFYIAEAAETTQMMFGRTIEPVSFVLSFALTMVFTVLIAFAMRGKLTRVNMVESLKSID